VAVVKRIPWFIVAPLAVLAQQTAAYALVGWSCAHQTRAPLHAVMAVAAFVVAVGLFSGWHDWRAVRVDRAVDAHGGAVQARSDFVALLNALTSLVALLVVVAQWIGVFVLSPCH
jgi:hypothetical protein